MTPERIVRCHSFVGRSNRDHLVAVRHRNLALVDCVPLPDSLAEKRISIHEVFQQMKLHPAILPLLEGGKTVEYGVHLVPEAGWNGVSEKLYRDGFLLVGDAAGFVINQGYTIRGMDLAIVSGVAAAKAVLAASEIPAIGPAYLQQLNVLGLNLTMQRFAQFPALMDNPRLFNLYPTLAADVFDQLFRIAGEVPEPLFKRVMGQVQHHADLRTLARDGWQMFRALR